MTLVSGPESSGAQPAPTGWWQRIIALNDRLWSAPTRLLSEVGVHVQLFSQAMFWLVRRPFRWRVLFEAMDFIGVQSLLIVGMIGTFVGMVFSLQLVSALRQFGTEGF